MTMHKAFQPRDDIDCMCEEKTEEEESPALKMALIHRYGDTKTT